MPNILLDHRPSTAGLGKTPCAACGAHARADVLLQSAV